MYIRKNKNANLKYLCVNLNSICVYVSKNHVSKIVEFNQKNKIQFKSLNILKNQRRKIP
jgi:hypothetical protein